MVAAMSATVPSHRRVRRHRTRLLSHQPSDKTRHVTTESPASTGARHHDRERRGAGDQRLRGRPFGGLFGNEPRLARLRNRGDRRFRERDDERLPLERRRAVRRERRRRPRRRTGAGSIGLRDADRGRTRPHQIGSLESVVSMHRSFGTVPTAFLSVSWRIRRLLLLSPLLVRHHHCARWVAPERLLVEGVK